MATTYTANARLQKPSTSDRNWDIPINANADALDAMSAIGSLAVTAVESPSSSLRVSVSPGHFVDSSGIIVDFEGTPELAIPASTTVYLWLSKSGTLTSGPSFPTTIHLRLARVISGPASIIQVVDERVQCSVAGTGLGFVMKAGDTMTGPLSVSTPVSGVPLLVADSLNRLIGFFGASPSSQAPVLNPLTSNSSGVASDTLVDVGTTISQAVLNNNFASLAAKVDALIAALKRHGLMAS